MFAYTKITRIWCLNILSWKLRSIIEPSQNCAWQVWDTHLFQEVIDVTYSCKWAICCAMEKQTVRHITETGAQYCTALAVIAIKQGIWQPCTSNSHNSYFVTSRREDILGGCACMVIAHSYTCMHVQVGIMVYCEQGDLSGWLTSRSACIHEWQAFSHGDSAS